MPQIADKQRLDQLDREIRQMIDKLQHARLDHPLMPPQPNETPEPGYRPNYIGREGECLRLAIASELGIPANTLPYIDAKPIAHRIGEAAANRAFWTKWMLALIKKGYYIMPVPQVPDATEKPVGIDGFWIAGVPGPGAESLDTVTHAVVMKDGRVHYDPTPDPSQNLEGLTVDQAHVHSQIWIWKTNDENTIDLLAGAVDLIKASCRAK